MSTYLASEIVNKIKKIIGYDINIMDKRGIIIASTNKKRINTFHQGALEVVKTGKNLEITDEDINKMEGVKPGINLPITFNNKVIGVVGITGNLFKVKSYGELVKTMVELMMQQTFLVEQIQMTKKSKEIFIYNLIHGNLRDINEDQIIMRGKVFGFDLNLPRICIVFNTNINSKKINELLNQNLSKKIYDVIENNLSNDKQDIVISLGNGNFVILLSITNIDNYNKQIEKIIDKCGNICTMLKRFDLEVCAGIGSLCDSISELKNSYKEALKAINIGKMIKESGLDMYHCKNNVFYFNDLGIYLLIDSLPEKTLKNYTKKYLCIPHDLNELLDDTLKKTLITFLDCGLNISKASRKLYIHRNTLLYRLNKIFKLTGRDPRIFSNAIDLNISLIIDTFKNKSSSAKNMESTFSGYKYKTKLLP
ncbi:MAG: carbohydrate diacid regulator [Thermosediminibacterales bacterium]|nr:carbohydrate diacid regulator [Thermosediminibacterales bacterium]MDK2835720.1 carbohydrate diacid regulator [Thermosediminibacterales bacterium]